MKKLIAAIMASAMVLTPILPASAEFLAEEAAETEVTSSYKPAPASVNEPTTEKLEKIIKAVKPKLDVPEEYTEFDWNYNSATYYRQASWHLTWFKKDYSGEVSVSCDAKGNITSYNTYDNNYDRAIKLPEFSKLELAETAKAFLEKLAPEAASSMVLTNSYASSFYSKSFIYSFVRYENGVTVPDNTASVTVNYITGVPTAMHVGYNGYVSFDAEKEIDEESAKKLLTENQTMNLSYKLKNEYDEDGKLICRKAYLVYTPQVSYLSVDAKTGKVYTERNTWNILENGAGGSVNGMFGAMADSSLKSESAEAESEYRLSEEELAQLAVLEKLISREEAIKAVTENEYLYIDPQATAVDAQLRQISAYTPYGASNDRENDTYRWDITFSAPSVASDKKSYFSPYMRASVDAQTGAIISFNAEVPGEYYYKNTETTPPELKYNSVQASEIFKKFANTVIPEYVEHTEKYNATPTNIIEYKINDDNTRTPVYRETSVGLMRVNEGVNFTYNTINGEVDLVTGKITRFSYTWYDDVEFESPKDAITPEEAYRALLDSDGFGLNYEINSNYTYHKYLEDEQKGYIDYDKLYTSEQYTRLVYSGYNYLSTTVSALTGELINYSGEPVSRKAETEYTDVSGHWAEKDINTLTDLGFSFEGTEFMPDSFISYGDYEKLMQFFNKYVYASASENPDRNAVLTRTEAVKYIIDAAGYYKIAAMPDIFITDFADNSELAREDVGFIAIARGLGLVQGNLGEFRPYDSITRAEAVTLMLNFMKLSD